MSMEQPPGHGLLIEPLKPEDYVFGGATKLAGEVINPDGDWLPYLPKFEHQAPLFETNSCASHGTLNAFEGLHKHLYGIELNLSDRMLAKGSGTNPAQGNTPQKVAEWFRKNWSAFDEDWAMAGVTTVDEYYKEFPDLLYSKAAIVKGEDEFGYEAITNPTRLRLKEALTKGAVCMSVALLQDENSLWYKPAGWRDSHWVWLVQIKENGNYRIFDSYEPSIKEIRADFIPEVAYRYALNERAVDDIIVSIKKLIKRIQDYIASLKPTPKPPAPPAPTNNLLNTMALAIQKHEGWYPTSRSYRNRNPGNCRYSSKGYLTKYGKVGKDPQNFAIFETYEIGFMYLKNLILEKAKAHPMWDLYAFFEEYAPNFDHNDSRHYAETVAKALTTYPETFKLSQLLA